MSKYHLYRLIRYGCAPLYIYAKSIDQIPFMIGESIFRHIDCVMRVTAEYAPKCEVGDFWHYGLTCEQLLDLWK